MQIKVFTFNPFQENTYILYDETKSCIIIDPGNFNDIEDKRLFDFIVNSELQPIAIYNTHCHIDHVYGIHSIMRKYDIPLYIPEGELMMLNSTSLVANMYGMPAPMLPETYAFTPRKIIAFGNTQLEVFAVPGHSPDHLIFYHQNSAVAIVGDTLFANSIGRTDLPGGNHDLLIQKIKRELYNLPGKTVVFPGHGKTTTIEQEKSHNPFTK